jgi:hypothetical protein
VTVFDYLECPEWRGWYAHDFDWAGRYLRVRRCMPEEVRAELESGEPGAQFSEPKRSQQ